MLLRSEQNARTLELHDADGIMVLNLKVYSNDNCDDFKYTARMIRRLINIDFEQPDEIETLSIQLFRRSKDRCKEGR